MSYVQERTVSLSIIGAGAMGSAIATALTVAHKQCTKTLKLSISNRSSEKLEHLLNKIEFIPYTNTAEMINTENPDVLIIASKPKDIAVVLQEIKNVTNKCLIISVLAGTSIKTIEEKFPLNPIIRAMPNTASQIGAGITALCLNKNCNEADSKLAKEIFSTVGKVLFIEDENKMHAITALSGSGPAYYFFLTEALIKAGIEQGLSPAEAKLLASQTFLGAGLLLDKSNLSPLELRQAVTSPNGTTHAAITSLEQNNFSDLISKAIEAATKRSMELGSLTYPPLHKQD